MMGIIEDYKKLVKTAKTVKIVKIIKTAKIVKIVSVSWTDRNAPFTTSTRSLPSTASQLKKSPQIFEETLLFLSQLN